MRKNEYQVDCCRQKVKEDYERKKKIIIIEGILVMQSLCCERAERIKQIRKEGQKEEKKS